MLFDCYNLLQVAKILNNYNKCHVWAQVEKRISGLPLVAHNRPFDENCLKAAYEKHWNGHWHIQHNSRFNFIINSLNVSYASLISSSLLCIAIRLSNTLSLFSSNSFSRQNFPILSAGACSPDTCNIQ